MNVQMRPGQKGFTRADAIALLLGVAVILGIVCLPFLSDQHESRRSQCTVHLKQTVLGYILWMQDNDQRLPYRVLYSEGGLKDPGTNQIQIAGIGRFDPALRSNAWLQFAFINKEINDPKVLLCPADMKNNRQRKPAASWGMEKGGLVSPGMQNNSISYCINLDVGFSPGGKSFDLPNSQTHMLLTERHMGYNTVNSACSANVGLANVVKIAKPIETGREVRWKDKDPRLHVDGGHVALLDGSTHQTNAEMLQDLLEQGDDNGELHFIYP